MLTVKGFTYIAIPTEKVNIKQLRPQSVFWQLQRPLLLPPRILPRIAFRDGRLISLSVEE
jgi:hypothetical protein